MSISGSTSGDPLAALLNERRIRALGDALFTLTDAKEWDAARALFVDGEIDVDMSSLAGGGPLRMTAAELFAGFAAGLHAGKESHHMATNFQVTVEGDTAWVSVTENILQGVSVHASSAAALNLFLRRSPDAPWRLVVHHGSPVAER